MKLIGLIVALMLTACDSKQSSRNARPAVPMQNDPTPSAAAAAEKSVTTSVYTKYDYDSCDDIQVDEETGDTISRCEGYAGIPLFVSYSDAREDLDAGVENEAIGIQGPIHHISDTIEWRLADGKPFAIIYRVETSPPYPKWSRLIVETIGTRTKPGCPIAELDGLRPSANATARLVAEGVITGEASCLEEMS